MKKIKIAYSITLLFICTTAFPSLIIKYPSCDIHIPSTIKSTYATNRQIGRVENKKIDHKILFQIEKILTDKGYNPYFFERKDGLSMRFLYKFNVNSSFSTEFHSIYSFLDIIEDGNLSYFDEFRYAGISRFWKEDYNIAFINTIKRFPSCEEI